MKMDDAYNRLLGEYLSKISACDECMAEYYCIENGLKRSREPQGGCEDKIRGYLRQL